MMRSSSTHRLPVTGTTCSTKPTSEYRIHDMMNEKRTTAEPSLSRLSPSIIVPSAVSAPRSLSSATTATGSVAETIVPRSQHALNDQCEYHAFTKSPVTSEATITPGPARTTICESCFRKMA